MAGHEWKDWFEREEFIGQISDIRVQNLQVERELVQKRTFTRWINLHLEKCDPKMEVQDLFRDIQDGRVLMALLDELSGCKLLHGFKKSAHRIFRLNNIAKVLSFLEERNVKLVSIDATDVADGNPSIVLGLIWNIILFFQIKELTGNIKSQFPSSSSLSSIPTGSDPDARSPSGVTEERRQASLAMRDQGRTIKKLLQWVQNRTRKFGVAVQDFSKSWTSGLAFLAVIKSIDSSLVDMRRALLRSAKENLEEAFRTAHFSLGIPRLLEPEDVTLSPPDEQSIMTYVSQFLEHFPGKEEPIKPHEVIERSISMGRLSSCDTELDQIRNGLHRSRLRERPYVVRKEPPPKIFISSMSEDRGLRSPTSPLAVARSWASEDSPVGSPLAAGGVFFISTSTSPQPYYINSPVGSESAIGDSAMGSPDSWVGSEAGGEAPEGFGESRSDGSLCDSGMAWDVSVPYASPEEDTTLDPTSTSPDKPQEEDDPLDLTSTSLDKPQEEDATLDPTSTSLDKPQEEDDPLDLTSTSLDKPQKEDAPLDLTSTSLDKPQEEQQFVDEGIYSLSSLESTQERIQVQSEKEEEEEEEEEANWHILHRNQEGSSERVPDHKEDENKAEKDSEQTDTSPLQRDRVSTEQRSSLGLYETPPQPDYGDAHSPEPKGTNQSQSSYYHPTDGTEEGTDGESECAEEAAELREGPQLQGQNVETESEGARHGADHEYHQPGRVAIKESCILYLVEEIEVETVRRRKDSLSEKEVEEAGILKGEVREGSEMQNEMSQGVLNDHADPQEGAATQIPEDLANIHPEHSVAVDRGPPNNQDGPLKSSLDSSTDLSGPQSQTFVPFDPPERGEEITCGPETEGQAGDEDPGLTAGASGSPEGPIDSNVPENPNETNHNSDEPEDANPLESALCLSGGPWAEKVHQVNSKHMKAMGNGHPGGTDERDTDSTGSQAAVDSPTLDRTDRPDGGFRDEPNAEAPGGGEETTDPRPDGSHRPVRSGEPATDMDFFYTEPLEPMDLFYPDKEEFTMFAEPLEAVEAESDWSVFHVSALQPATPSPEPATPPSSSSSDPEILCVFQETNIYLLPPETPQALSGDEGSAVRLSTQEQEEEMMVMMENHHPLGAPSEAQQWCSSGGEEDGEEEGEEERAWRAEPEEGQCPAGRDSADLWGRDAEGLPAGEIMEAVRTEAGGAMSPDESLVVRHRPGSPASKDNQTKVSSSKTHSNNFDLGTKEREELAVLLLLWLLLYCLWVLPQIDFSFSLLFNLDH